MFENLKSLTKLHKNPGRNDIISFLNTSPEKLAEFEDYYKTNVLSNDNLPDNPMDINAKQASQICHKDVSNYFVKKTETITDRIVNELIQLTEIHSYDGNGLVSCVQGGSYPSDLKNPVTVEEIMAIPEEIRPNLAGTLMQKVLNLDENEAGISSLMLLKKIQETDNVKIKNQIYGCFRQGLEISDLDPLMYAIIDRNVESFGHWFPELVVANVDKDFFKIPKTTYVKLPITLLQLTRNEYMSLTPTTKQIVDEWAMKVFELDTSKEYFIKNGVYSSKFDFRNCHVYGEQEVRELGEYLLYIHFAASQMASPLNHPCIYGPGTTNEWVVREFIPDKENNPIIYKGLSLHTEYRVFIDCDTKEVLGINPYWDPDVMKKRFDEHRDDHDEHDAIVYRAYENTLMKRYEENKDLICKKVTELLPDLNLHGQWSLDVMQNGNDFWLIDMALAEQSAFYNKAVKLEDRRPVKENWIPEI